MTDLAIKKRLRRAIKAAARYFLHPPGNYHIVFLNNHIFHLEVIRKKEIRKIRVVLDEIKSDDIMLVKEIKFPENITKEIWCRKLNGTFEIKEIF